MPRLRNFREKKMYFPSKKCHKKSFRMISPRSDIIMEKRGDV